MPRFGGDKLRKSDCTAATGHVLNLNGSRQLVFLQYRLNGSGQLVVAASRAARRHDVQGFKLFVREGGNGRLVDQNHCRGSGKQR